MNTTRFTLLAGMTGIALTVPASAAILGFSPPSSDLSLGGSVSVDVYIDGLPGVLALGSYQLTVSYDAARVEVTGLTFPTAPSSGLDLGAFGSISGSDLSVAGQASFDETSLEDVSDLTANQPDSFVLARLTLKGLSLGSSPLTFALVDLADVSGAALGNGTLNQGLINVVPEPHEYALIAGLGLVGFAAWRRRG